MRRVFVFLLWQSPWVFFFFLSPLWGQTRLLRNVERLYYRGDYISLVQQDLPSPVQKPTILLYYASAYYHLGERDKAYALYREAFSKLSPAEIEHPFLTEYGQLCLYNENPSLALELFNQALQRTAYADSQALLSKYIAYANQLKNYQEIPPEKFRWVVYPLSYLNTPEHEYSLFVHKGYIYFISRRDEARGTDPEDFLPHEALYRAKREDTVVQPLRFFSKKHEGIAGFLKDTLIVYRSAHRRGDFYIAYPRGEGWAQPQRWKAFPNSRRGSEDALCEDPKTGDIIFSSDRKGTKGGDDLWLTRRLPGGKFAPPENLSALNTPYNEDAPFIVGDTLYFAHDGPTSIGGYDIFYSVRQERGGWGKPQRLPRPFNSPGHDSYLFFPHPDSVYLSSDRTGGKGKMDLYLLVREPLPPSSPPETLPRQYTLSGRIYDRETKRPVPALVILRPVSDTLLSLSSWEAEADGSFSRPKPLRGQYLLHVCAEGYAQYLEPFFSPDTGDVWREIPMIPAEVLNNVQLPRLHFDFDRHTLRAEAPPALDTVIQVLRQYPTLILQVSGHTDSIGTREYNQGLSERRARTVYNYLMEKNIAPHRLQWIGYGEDRPLVPNTSPYNRFLNRRVEFIPLTGRP
ncbi:MAG: OmpA family protein [Bacteroidia bacterium]|nr:OmpA family protein [Bacteroidia bacterium]